MVRRQQPVPFTARQPRLHEQGRRQHGSHTTTWVRQDLQRRHGMPYDNMGCSWLDARAAAVPCLAELHRDANIQVRRITASPLCLSAFPRTAVQADSCCSGRCCMGCCRPSRQLPHWQDCNLMCMSMYMNGNMCASSSSSSPPPHSVPVLHIPPGLCVCWGQVRLLVGST